MTLHIRGTTTGPVVLGPNSKRLTSITSTGAVISNGTGADGIDGPATNPWSIENDGTVTSASGVGINLLGAGTINNGPSALISGYLAGVRIDGTPASVTNAGAITGSGPGTVAPVTSGTILGDGIAFFAGGNVTNNAGGSISGSLGFTGPSNSDSAGSGVFIGGGAGTVSNYGAVSGSAYGIALDAGGTVTNTSSISGAEDGIKIINATGSVSNSGSIVASRDDGVALFNGGSVSNAAGALISAKGTSGMAAGVFIKSGSGSLTNGGTIGGSTFGALLASGSVTNSADASITGTTAGVQFNAGAGTLTNFGGITGVTAGADLEQGGSVTNAAGASISGSTFGVFITGGPGTVTTAGTISGGTDAVAFSGSGPNRLVVEPGAVLNGGVSGASTFVVDPGATLNLNGSNTIPTVLNDGTLGITGSLDVSAAIDPSSTGLFRLDGGSALEVAAAVGSGSQMSFLSPSELAIDDTQAFGTNIGSPDLYSGPLLGNFAVGDSIDLKDFSFIPGGVTLDPLTPNGVLQLTNGSEVADLKFASLGGGTLTTGPETGGGSGTLLILT